MPRHLRRPATSAEAQRAPWGLVALHCLPAAVTAVLLALAFATVTACTPGSFMDDGELDDPGSTGGDAQDEEDALVAHAPLDVGLDLPGPGPQRLDPVPIDPLADPGPGQFKLQREGAWIALVLQSASYDVRVMGTVAETTVTQLFVNPFDEPIEAIYQFPLPEDAAVDGYRFRLGEHRVEGEIRRRAEARELYEQAREAGETAGLLEQERPNLFSQSLANIPPGAAITVELHLVQPLRLHDGLFRLALPTTVGPRFVPEGVPDAERVSPAVLAPNLRSGTDLAIRVHLDTSLPVHALRSTTHRIHRRDLPRGVQVRLHPSAQIPNRDFVLQWRHGDDAPAASLQAQVHEGSPYFALSFQPPARRERARSDQPPARPRELIFVVDNSCSMSGEPLAIARQAMHRALDDLGPDDRFQVLRFSEEASALAPAPLPSTPDAVAKGHAYVDAMHGMGGTHMLAGIEAALRQPHDPEALKLVLFLTDGYIGNETQIFSAIDLELGDTRLFALGVGSSVNRYLLEGMADMGRGGAHYVGAEQSPEAAVADFYAAIARPVLTDIHVDWGDLPVRDLVPAKIPDLFDAQPLSVFGRLDPGVELAAGAHTVTVHGRLGDQETSYELKLELVDGGHQRGAIASLWARQRIAELERAQWRARGGEGHAQLEAQITELGLRHGLMTAYTAFVAVLHGPRGQGDPRQVIVPGEMPSGVQLPGVATGAAGTVGLGAHGVVGRGGGGSGVRSSRSGSGYGIGSGSGYGRGGLVGHGVGGRGARVPRVRMAQATVRGSLDRAIVRRIVRAHINELRGCYNQSLARDPALAGRLVLRFVIAPGGEVIEARADEDSIGDPAMQSCVVSAVRRWTFPSPPDASTVIVVYPFNFAPEEP